MVAIAPSNAISLPANGPRSGGQRRTVPCCSVTLNRVPNKAFPAVAPSATTTRGRTADSSAVNQGEQAAIFLVVGFWCSRRGPLSVLFHLKCFTALVT